MLPSNLILAMKNQSNLVVLSGYSSLVYVKYMDESFIIHISIYLHQNAVSIYATTQISYPQPSACSGAEG